MLTDLYQLTMMYGYYKSGNTEKEAVFDLFFRETGNHRAYAVLCGIESIIDYINNLRFTTLILHTCVHSTYLTKIF